MNYEPLQSEQYEYCFIIDDVYGDYLMTEPALFTVDDDGSIQYE